MSAAPDTAWADELGESMREDFRAIQMARPPYVLDALIVKAHHHPAQQWAQCVLEMQIAHTNLRRAVIKRKILLREIRDLRETGRDLDALHADEKLIDVEQQDYAALGAVRELEALYAIYRTYPRQSRDALNAAQPDLYRNRLLRQAENDMIARQTGVGAGNVESLRLVGAPIPGLLAQPSAGDRIADVQTRYLSEGKQRILCVVPTERPPADGKLPVLDGLIWPGEVEHRLHCIYGMAVADAYNEAALTAIKEGATHLLTIEDDTFPPCDAVTRLLRHEVDIVGAWYPKRQPGARVGTPIAMVDNARRSLDDPDGTMRQVYTIPMGCTLIRTDVFRRLPYPWYVTTPQLTQDSYFSQQARDAGYVLWCDTSLRCRHVDRVTGEVFV